MEPSRLSKFLWAGDDMQSASRLASGDHAAVEDGGHSREEVVGDNRNWSVLMSRSKRSEPVTGITTADSEKEWKRSANRRLRHASSQVVRQVPTSDPDAMVLPVMDEVANLWSGPKDGKLRFDPVRHPKLMRK